MSVIGAVSPPGGDFSEPVTQQTKRFVRTFWGLDKELAAARYFPAINPIDSYSEYPDLVAGWWAEHVDPGWQEMRGHWTRGTLRFMSLPGVDPVRRVKRRRVGPELVHHLQGIDDVAQGLAHLAALLVADQPVQVDRFERQACR